jgi:hypothetical protein
MMLERLLLLFGKYPLDFISDLSSILPIIIGIINYKFLSNNLRIILLFFGMYLIGDTYMIWLGLIKKNNLFILNIYPIGGILLLTNAYISTFKTPSAKRLIIGLSILFSIVCLAYFKFLEISAVELFAYRAYIIILVLMYFNKTLADMRIKNILIHSLFWVSSGIIIYATGTFFISIFSEIIFNPNLIDDRTFDTYWKLNNVLFILLVALSSIGIWFSKYERENLL